MRKAIILLFSFFTISSIGFAQKDSLLLILASEYKAERDSANSYSFRIDFISKKINPIEFYYAPCFPMNCCDKSPDDPIGIEIQRLDSICYRELNRCADCDPIYLGVDSGILCMTSTQKIFSESNKRILRHSDTISYRESLPVFDRYGRNRKSIGFYGNYRCRAYRYYYEQGNRRKIYSNWLYINFPDRI